MNRFSIFLTLVVLLFHVVCTTAAEEAPRITNLSVIPIKPGINKISDFSSEGREATIVEAWRENGNAGGYNVFMITLSKPDGGLDVVNIRTPSQKKLEDTIRDAPHVGEDYIRSIRFAHGFLDDKSATFLITAERDMSHFKTLYDSVETNIDFYVLSENDDIGATSEIFDHISQIRTKDRFCNSDVALEKTLNLPMPEDYGPHGEGACH